MKVRPGFIFLTLFLFSISAFAGKDTGVILGTITDGDGEAIPGVTISAFNSSMVGWHTLAYSGLDGYYRFAALPSGMYEIKAELNGFRSVVRKDIRLFVGMSITVDFVLEPQPIIETMEVSGNSPALDVTTPATPATIPQEFVEKLPRTFGSISLFALTPGINEDDAVAYGGGGPQANGYWFDGVDASDPVMGGIWQIPNYNWIQEVQVIGLGAPAEYGGFMGVVSNTITRSGGNEFHGLFETFFQNNSFTATNTDNPDLKPPTVDLFTDSSVQVGGPILRDKLWFFSGLQYYYKRDAPIGYPAGGGEAFRTYEEPKFLGKFTYRLNQDNHFQGFIEYEDYKWIAPGATALFLPEATASVDSPGWFWNLSWMSILSPNTLLDIRTSGLQAEWDELPRDPDLPGHIEVTTGIHSVNRVWSYESDRGRTQANVSLSHYARDFLQGDHDFKFGVQYEHSNAHQVGGYTGGALYYDYLGGPYYRYLSEGYDLNTGLNHISSFAQNNWNVSDKLAFSLGVRWDLNRVTQGNIKMVTNPVAPRIGFVYDFSGNQTTVIKAHYGHYYESAITFFVDQSGPIADTAIEWFDPQKQQWIQTDVLTVQEAIDPKIKAQYTQQFTAGVDQQLSGNLVFGAHYIYRKDRDLIEDVEVLGIYEPFEWVNPLTGETMTLFRRQNPGENLFLFTNPPEAYRLYHGFQLTGSKRFSNKFVLTGSLVISQARGNLDNTFGGGTGYTRQFDSPNLNINFDGKLTNDVTYEMKLSGYYDLPGNISTSWFFRHYSGDTWTPVYSVSRDVNEEFLNVFLLPRGSNRLPGRNILDWRLEKAFPLRGGELKCTMDMFNVFNTGYPLRVVARFDRQTFGQPVEFSFPRQIRLGVRYQF